MKYIGTGLTRPLNSFLVQFSTGGINLYEGEKKLSLYVHPCSVDSGYACYVCSECDEEPEMYDVTIQEVMS